ncbi:MAG: Na+/H+ antiporter subunit E [Burkholderiaceae bacterium]|nr:Na+/H+ antiporter subunit E [Microbacteriaceae bacterium]
MTELTQKELRARVIQQLPLLVALVVLWMLLWGAISWLNVLTGTIVAIVVTRVFYLPPVELTGRFNPLWFAVFLGRFAVDLVVASFQVAAQAFDPRGVSRNSIIAVQLRTRSDIMMTVTSIAMSLVPGSLIVEADRMRSTLYLHSLNTRDLAAVEKVRRHVLATEARLVRSFGSKDDLRRTTQ